MAATWIEWLREGGAPADPALPLIPRSWVRFSTEQRSAVQAVGRECDPVYGRLDWEYKGESDLGSLGVARALGGFSITGEMLNMEVFHHVEYKIWKCCIRH